MNESHPSTRVGTLREEYGQPNVSDAELYAADVLTQIQHQELHHGPVTMRATTNPTQVSRLVTGVRVSSRRMDDERDVIELGTFPLTGVDHALRAGYLLNFDGGVTVTAAGVEYLNGLRQGAGWEPLRRPVENLVAVVGENRLTELRKRPGGIRVVSCARIPEHIGEQAPDIEDVIQFSWLVPEQLVTEAINEGLLQMVANVGITPTEVRRTAAAASFDDNFRVDPSAERFDEAVATNAETGGDTR